MVAEATEAMLRQVKAEMTVSSLTCVLSAYDDSNALEQLWAYVDTAEKLASQSSALRIPTLVTVGISETARLSIWMTQ